MSPFTKGPGSSTGRSPPSPSPSPSQSRQRPGKPQSADQNSRSKHILPVTRPLSSSSNWSLLEEINASLDSSFPALHPKPPTPPTSASPTGGTFDLHPSNPFSTSSAMPQSRSQSRQSLKPASPSQVPAALASNPSSVTPPPSPPSSSQQSRRQSSCSQKPLPPAPSLRLDPSRSRIKSSSPRPRSTFGYPNHYNSGRGSSPSQSNNQRNSVRRHSSLQQRFPNDMSHRPLDMIKRDAKAADRPLRRRKNINETDTIDALDTVGGAYHHGGPYDATLISRNLNKKYSPVAAVRESNMAAIRATPRENIIDSLTKHVPLQGTSTVPVGCRDMSGRVMRYEEGADLMREPDAPGGAYKRWDSGVHYHPDDLKGKGEPSYTIERDLQKGKKPGHKSEPHEFELRSMHRYSKSAASRPRSISQSGEASSSNADATGNSGLGRRNSTGKKLGDGLKRRFVSLRRKKDMPSEAVY